MLLVRYVSLQSNTIFLEENLNFLSFCLRMLEDRMRAGIAVE